MYFVESSFVLVDKASGPLKNFVFNLEKADAGVKSFILLLKDGSKALEMFGLAAKGEIVAFRELNTILSGTNRRLAPMAQHADAGAKAMGLMATESRAAAADVAVLARELETANAAARGTRNQMRGIGSAAGSAARGGAEHTTRRGHRGGHDVNTMIQRAGGHFVNSMIDTMLGLDIAREALRPGQERENAILHMKKTGMFNEQEQKQAMTVARQMTKAVPGKTVTQHLETITELAQGMQNASIGLKLAPQLIQKSSVMEFMSGGDGHVSKNKAFATGRVLELLNMQKASTKDQEKIIDLLARSSATTHRKAGPEAMAHYFANMGATRFGADPESTIKFASYAIQEMGVRAGSQMNAFQRALTLGTVTKGGALGLQQGGLLPPGDIPKDVSDRRVFVQKNMFKRELLQKSVTSWFYEAVQQIVKTNKLTMSDFDKMDHKQKQKLFLPIFGALNMNAFAQSDMLGQQLDTIAEHSKNMDKADTSVGNVSGTQEQKLTAVSAAWNDFWATLDTMPPVIKTVNELLDGTVNILRGWDSSLESMKTTMPSTVQSMNELAESMGTVGGAVGDLTKKFGGLMPTIDKAISGLIDLSNPKKQLAKLLDPVNVISMAGMAKKATKPITNLTDQMDKMGTNAMNWLDSFGKSGKPHGGAAPAHSPAASAHASPSGGAGGVHHVTNIGTVNIKADNPHQMHRELARTARINGATVAKAESPQVNAVHRGISK